MITIRELIKTLYNAFNQKLKKHRGNWEQNDPTADDYIKNRPFYTDDSEKVVIVPNQQITFSDNRESLTLPEIIEFVVGQNYEVKWDNVKYTCVAWVYNGLVAIGNQSLISIDTGEPFTIVISKAEGVGMAVSSTTGTHTVEVTSVKIVKIDKKYLPNFARVATSGSYNDLTDTPKLPAVIPAEKLPEIPAEKLPEIPAEKLPEIPTEKLPDIHRIEKTFEGTFDQITEGRDTFKWNAFNYYKISEIIPRRSDVISFSGTCANGEVFSTITEGENCCGYGFFIVVYQPGTCKLNVTSTVAYSFTAQSAGIYARNEPNDFSHTAGTYRFDCLIYSHIIQSTITLKKYYLDVDDSGALIATEVTE